MKIRHIRTRPFRPRTNGKAERSIRTMLGGWAYGAIYRDSAQRTAALSGWLDFYNWRRPHAGMVPFGFGDRAESDPPTCSGFVKSG
jgi:transposase InsO family protein